MILDLTVASDSSKPIDDAVDPDAGSWLHSPCHSHPQRDFSKKFFYFQYLKYLDDLWLPEGL